MGAQEEQVTPRGLHTHPRGLRDRRAGSGPEPVDEGDRRSARCGPAPHGRARALLLGMGNPILSDDAIGIRLAERLAKRLMTRPGEHAKGDLDVVPECTVGGLNLLDVIAGYECVIVIDSIKTAGGVVGSWYRFDATDLRSTMNLRNVHDTNFATALQLGREMGMVLPRDDAIHVFAVRDRRQPHVLRDAQPRTGGGASPSFSTRSARRWRPSWTRPIAPDAAATRAIDAAPPPASLRRRARFVQTLTGSP